MNREINICLISAAIILAGCNIGTVGIKAGAESKSIAAMNRTSLQKAQHLQVNGLVNEAMVEYRKLMDLSMSDQERKQANLGFARCLIRLRQYPAAFSSLQPLPMNPASDTEMHILAVAGEALLYMNKSSQAEALLEIAIGESISGDLDDVALPSWMAECCANLGAAYLKNNKPIESVVMYENAIKLFNRKRDYKSARQARRMAGNIKNILNLH